MAVSEISADESTGSAPDQSDSADQATSPPPRLSLVVTESGPQLPWRMEVRNIGEQPALLTADPQLLWLQVKVPGKKRVATCRLPKELFPTRPNKQAELRLGPGEAAARQLDPRLYCYSEGGQWQLVPGSQITPHFGWPEKTKTTWKHGKRIETVIDAPPYVAYAVGAENQPATDSDSDIVGHLKVIKGHTFALGSNYAVWSRSRLPDPEQPQGPFELKLASGSDAHAERTATVQLSLKNRSNRSRYVYFRRELVSFEVMGPQGLVPCDPEPDYRAPNRHSFSYLPAGKSLTVTSRLIELCPRGTFGQPGLYLVHARFDSHLDGEEFELDAFVGRVTTRDAVGVRIRTGEKRPLRLRRVREQAGNEARTTEN